MMFFYNTLCPPGKKTMEYIGISTIAYALRAKNNGVYRNFYNSLCPPGKKTIAYTGHSTIPYALRAKRIFYNNPFTWFFLLPRSG
jgi:hypothetical protein